MHHLKEYCIGCGRTKAELKKLGIAFTKEHVLPEWLIKITNTNSTGIKWNGKYIPASRATIPLCKECNTIFGDRLESPTQKIFKNIESGLGLSDHEAEILVRWMWKLEGMQWYINHENCQYSDKYTLKDRVVNDIDQIRPYITLSISLIKEIEQCYDDYPMGLDSFSELSGIFVSGVFSKLAIITSHSKFDYYIPKNYTKYHLSSKLNKNDKSKVFLPKTGFINDTDAVYITMMISKYLQYLHEVDALNIEQNQCK